MRLPERVGKKAGGTCFYAISVGNAPQDVPQLT